MGGKEHEYTRDTRSHEPENEAQSGELAKGEEQKLPSGHAPKKSPFLEALVQMNVQRVENQLLREQLDKQQKTDKDKEQPAKEARSTPKYDLDEPPPEAFEPRLACRLLCPPNTRRLMRML